MLAVGALAQKRQREEHRRQRDRHAEQEYAAPTEAVDQRAAGYWSAGLAGEANHIHDAKRAAKLVVRDRNGDYRRGAGRDERGRDALYRAEEEQESVSRRHAAQCERDRDDTEADDEDGLAPEDIGEPATPEHHARGGENVCDDRPLHQRDIEMKGGGNRRESYVE